jgi:hypothetical protein
MIVARQYAVQVIILLAGNAVMQHVALLKIPIPVPLMMSITMTHAETKELKKKNAIMAIHGKLLQNINAVQLVM